MLYDEPTSGLDPLTTGTITRLILKLQRELERDQRRRLARHPVGVPHGDTRRRAATSERIAFFGTPEEMAAVRRQVHPRLPGRLLTMKRSSIITWDQLRVGLVILVAVLVIGVAIYKLGQAANLFAKRYELIAFLPDANGLREGGTVMVAGQLAGTVTKIEFLPVDTDTTRNLKLTLAVDDDVQEQIRTRLQGASCARMGLLGDKVFDITPGTPRYQPLATGDTVTVGPVARLRGGDRAGQRRGERHGGAHARTCAPSPAASCRARARSGSSSRTARSTTS